MSQFALVAQIQDHSIRHSLQEALKNDRRISFLEVKTLLRSALDGKGVTQTEFNDLKTLLKNAKSLDRASKELIQNFLKQNYQPPTKPKVAPTGALTANFNISEFASNDGEAVPAKYLDNVKRLATNLQTLRDALGKPIHINSGYRSVKHNKTVGGKPYSQHLYAKAADIRVSGLTPSQVKKKIESLIKDGKMTQGGIGLYNTFVHYDIRGTKARW
jgi:uncharacterized protein YcbK (DUF882 family)